MAPLFTAKVFRSATGTVEHKYVRPTTVSASCNATGSSPNIQPPPYV